MKRLAFTLLLIISCSRTNETENNNNTNNVITVKKIEIIENSFDYNTPFVSNITINFSYINNNISKINYNITTTQNSSTTERNSQIYLDYINNKLSSVKDGFSTMKFNYTNSKLTSIDYLNIKGYSNKNAVFNVIYNNDKIDYIECDYPYYYVKNKFNYSSDNKLNGITIYKNNSVYKIYNIALDNKNNPFKNISNEEKIYFGLMDGYGYFIPFEDNYLCSFFGENNVITYNDYKFNYTYNSDGFPSSLNLSFPYSSTQTSNSIYKFTY